MKKNIITFLILIHCFPFLSFPQANIVPNGSFESKMDDDFFCGVPVIGCAGWTSCENVHTGEGCCCCNLALYSNITLGGNNPDGAIPFVKNWNTMFNQTGTPDYFNSCAPTSDFASIGRFIVHVPDNGQGYQNDHSGGNAYIGIIARLTPNIPDPLYTEYLQVQLSSALVAGKQYKATMFVSLADNSKYACPGLSMLFTQGKADGGGLSQIVGFVPQIQNTVTITDKQNWVEVSGIFTASGSEEWLTIGVFDAALSAPALIDPGASNPTAYYYIDDVTVIADGNDCCPDHQLFQNTNQLPTFTEVNDYIKAGNNVDSDVPQGPVVVQSGQHVTFQAGNQIILEPGFSTEPGAYFVAQNAPCHNWDLYPYPITAFVPNAWAGCPGTDQFCIPITGADHWSFQVYASWGEKVYDNSGTIDGYYTCIWDGLYNGGQPNDNVAVYVLTLTDNCGGELVLNDDISLFNGCKMMNTISTNNDSINSYQNSIIYIVPNPSNGKFQIMISNPQFAKENTLQTFNVIVQNVLGEAVYNSINQLIAPSATIDLSSHPKGIYFIKVQSTDPDKNGTNKIYTEKVVIQ